MRSALLARRHFPADLDQLDEAVDAVVDEGHDAFVAQAEDQMRPSSRSIFDGDVEQEVDVPPNRRWS